MKDTGPSAFQCVFRLWIDQSLCRMHRQIKIQTVYTCAFLVLVVLADGAFIAFPIILYRNRRLCEVRYCLFLD